MLGENSITSESLKRAEFEICQSFGWNVAFFTFFDYLEHFLSLGSLFEKDCLRVVDSQSTTNRSYYQNAVYFNYGVDPLETDASDQKNNGTNEFNFHRRKNSQRESSSPYLSMADRSPGTPSASTHGQEIFVGDISSTAIENVVKNIEARALELAEILASRYRVDNGSEKALALLIVALARRDCFVSDYAASKMTSYYKAEFPKNSHFPSEGSFQSHVSDGFCIGLRKYNNLHEEISHRTILSPPKISALRSTLSIMKSKIDSNLSSRGFSSARRPLLTLKSNSLLRKHDQTVIAQTPIAIDIENQNPQLQNQKSLLSAISKYSRALKPCKSPSDKEELFRLNSESKKSYLTHRHNPIAHIKLPQSTQKFNVEEFRRKFRAVGNPSGNNMAYHFNLQHEGSGHKRDASSSRSIVIKGDIPVATTRRKNDKFERLVGMMNQHHSSRINNPIDKGFTNRRSPSLEQNNITPFAPAIIKISVGDESARVLKRRFSSVYAIPNKCVRTVSIDSRGGNPQIMNNHSNPRLRTRHNISVNAASKTPSAYNPGLLGFANLTSKKITINQAGSMHYKRDRSLN